MQEADEAVSQEQILYERARSLAQELTDSTTPALLADELYNLLANFKDIPSDEFLHQIIECSDFPSTSFFSRYEHFTITDESALVRLLLQRADYRLALAENAAKIRCYTLQQVTDLILQQGDSEAAAALCAWQVEIDQDDVVSRLFANGQINAVIRNLESFRGIDYQFVYQKLKAAAQATSGIGRENIVNVLIQHMYLWSEFANVDDIDLLLGGKSFFYNIEKMSDEIVTNPKVRAAFLAIDSADRAKIINNLSLYENYRGARILLLFLDDADRQQFDCVNKYVARFIELKNQENYQLAHELLLLIQVFDSSYQDQDVVEAKERESDSQNQVEHEAKRESFPAADIRKTVLEFHINFQFLNQISDLERLLEHPEELNERGTTTPIVEENTGLRAQARELKSLRDRAMLANIEHRIKSKIEAIFFAVRQYAFVIVQKEGYWANGYKVPIVSSSECEYSASQIVDYLERLMSVMKAHGRHMMGGTQWAKIVELARDAWSIKPDGDTGSKRNVYQMAALTDRMFQVEHNTNRIFNKDPRFLFQGSLNETLGLCFANSDISERLAYGKQAGILTEEEIEEYQDMQRSIQYLLQADVKTITD